MSTLHSHVRNEGYFRYSEELLKKHNPVEVLGMLPKVDKTYDLYTCLWALQLGYEALAYCTKGDIRCNIHTALVKDLSDWSEDLLKSDSSYHDAYDRLATELRKYSSLPKFEEHKMHSEKRSQEKGLKVLKARLLEDDFYIKHGKILELYKAESFLKLLLRIKSTSSEKILYRALFAAKKSLSRSIKMDKETTISLGLIKELSTWNQSFSKKSFFFYASQANLQEQIDLFVKKFYPKESMTQITFKMDESLITTKETLQQSFTVDALVSFLTIKDFVREMYNIKFKLGSEEILRFIMKIDEKSYDSEITDYAIFAARVVVMASDLRASFPGLSLDVIDALLVWQKSSCYSCSDHSYEMFMKDLLRFCQMKYPMMKSYHKFLSMKDEWRKGHSLELPSRPPVE